MWHAVPLLFNSVNRYKELKASLEDVLMQSRFGAIKKTALSLAELNIVYLLLYRKECLLAK